LGEWNKKEIGAISQMLKGTNLSKDNLRLDGKNYCIHYGELFTDYNEIINTVLSKTNLEIGLKSNVGDILMPSSDVTPEGLGRASALLVSGVLLGNDINVIRLKNSDNPKFISYLINHRRQDFIRVISGTTVKHLYIKDLANIKITTPNSISEQQKIADCLSSLDKLLEAQTEKINTLKTHKTALMQQLFPSF